MARRGLTREHVLSVVEHPDQVLDVRPGRVVMQRTYGEGDPPKSYLLRVFVDIDRTPPVIVTAYRTSKIEKYRGTP